MSKLLTIIFFAVSILLSITSEASSLLPHPFSFPQQPRLGASSCTSCAKSKVNREELSFDSFGRALLKINLDVYSPVKHDILKITAGLPVSFFPGEKYAVITPGAKGGHKEYLIIHAERRKVIFKTKNMELGKLSFQSNNYPGYSVRRDGTHLILSSLRSKRQYIFETPDNGFKWRITSVRDTLFKARNIKCKYDKDGLLTDIIYPDGKQFKIEYKDGVAVKVTDPYQALTTISWSGGFVSAIETALSPKHPFYPEKLGRGKPFVIRSIHLQCDSVGRIVNMVNTDGERFTCEYQKSENKKEKTSTFRGIITTPGGTQKYCKVTWNKGKSAEFGKQVEKGVLFAGTDAVKKDMPTETRFYNKKANVYSTFKKITFGKTFKYQRNDKTCAVTAKTDPLGNTTWYTYNEQGLRTSITYPDGSSVKFTYDKANRILTTTDEGGRTTSYKYNAKGLPESINNSGKVTKYEYDAAGRPVKTITPDKLTHGFSWDSLFRMTEYVKPDGVAVDYKYAANKVVEIKNISTDKKESYARSFNYDPNSRLVKISYPDNSYTKFKYDCCNLIQSRDRAGAITKFAFDARHRKVLETSPNDGKTILKYSKASWLEDRVAEIINPDKTVAKYEYDTNGKLHKEIKPDGTWIRYRYNIAGNKVESYYSDGTVSHFKYDSRNRLIAISGTHQDNIRNKYNSAGRMISSTNHGLPPQPEGRVTTFQYDKLGRLLKTSYPDGTSQVKYYIGFSDKLKALVSKGVITSYKYDDAGRLIAIAKYSVADLKKGKENLFDNNITETRSYDSFGNLKEVKRAIASAETPAKTPSSKGKIN